MLKIHLISGCPPTPLILVAGSAAEKLISLAVFGSVERKAKVVQVIFSNLGAILGLYTMAACYVKHELYAPSEMFRE